MDQDKFDQHLMGYLFDELDEVTAAAMKRKIEADADCRDLVAGLRATIEVAKLPLEEPSDDLEERILAAANVAQAGEPFHRKVLRSLSWAGSWAMRPQLAMAALLMLVIGSSVLLMRARPGAVGVTPTKEATPVVAASEEDGATEAPAAEPEAVAMADDAKPQADQPETTATAAPSADRAAAASGAPAETISYDQAMADYKAGRFGDAQRGFNQVASRGGAQAPTAALFEARSARAQSGCNAAVPLYEQVRARHGSAAAGADATFELGDCLRQLGRTDEALQVFASLADNDQYRERVAHELSEDATPGTSGGSALASKQRAAAPKAARAKPAPASPAPAPPAGGSGKGGVAAPREMDSLDQAF
ncbi:MAG: tetratricopeptide repeat protein [Polyangiaceae bacterium]